MRRGGALATGVVEPEVVEPEVVDIGVAKREEGWSKQKCGNCRSVAAINLNRGRSDLDIL
jgi:hypothetical protein